jgi:hypothetical protein
MRLRIESPILNHDADAAGKHIWAEGGSHAFRHALVPVIHSVIAHGLLHPVGTALEDMGYLRYVERCGGDYVDRSRRCWTELAKLASCLLAFPNINLQMKKKGDFF